MATAIDHSLVLDTDTEQPLFKILRLKYEDALQEVKKILFLIPKKIETPLSHTRNDRTQNIEKQHDLQDWVALAVRLNISEAMYRDVQSRPKVLKSRHARTH